MQIVKTEDRVTSEVQNIRFGFCVKENDEDYESYTSVDDMTEEETELVAKRLGITAEFLNEVDRCFSDLRDATHRELANIWQEIQ